MKYRMIKGSRPYKTTYGGITYEFDADNYREYPQALVSLFGKCLEPEPEPEPAKPKTKPETEDN